MSTTFTISGKESVLSANFNPPIYLDEDKEYYIGLVNFESFMVIPNIEPGCNKFYIGNKVIKIPEGSYELRDLTRYLKTEIAERYPKEKIHLSINGNTNTLKTTIKCTHSIDFTHEDSIGKLLGFERTVIPANRKIESENVIDILKVNAICIDCNLATGSFHNNKPVHVIYQFFPSIPPGHKIVESPLPVLYFPVSVKTINNIILRVVDQNYNIINFRGEVITIRLHLTSTLKNNGYSL